ncbi:hypothetical protein [Litorivita pollutaquae]|uniref:hypothetical protein n=1 Tax=Litorivita pollutaquae TaxID=2200892 RepID=UPI0013A67B2E|nr:hypothetical protein [Litorivita pollutaquae]
MTKPKTEDRSYRSMALTLKASRCLDGASDEERKLAFDLATHYLARLNYKGNPVSDDQPFPFPRIMDMGNGPENIGMPWQVGDAWGMLQGYFHCPDEYTPEELEQIRGRISHLLVDE